MFAFRNYPRCIVICTAVFSIKTVPLETKDTENENDVTLRKLENLEQQQRETSQAVQDLKFQNSALNTIVAKQNHKIHELQQQMIVQQNELTLTTNKLEEQNHEFRNVTSYLIKNLKPNDLDLRKRSGLQGVAFTAYLDHDISLGDYRTIKFNQVIINEENGYNPKTGLFMCPRSGVYLFTFSIGERDIAGTHIRLVRNGDNVIDGAVDTFNVSQDLQATSAAALRLNEHDLVWIEASGDHIEGSSDLRLSSFTGVFLYE